jgi:hypothetical protein
VAGTGCPVATDHQTEQRRSLPARIWGKSDKVSLRNGRLISIEGGAIDNEVVICIDGNRLLEDKMADGNARAGREQREEKIKAKMAKENARAGSGQRKEKIKKRQQTTILKRPERLGSQQKPTRAGKRHEKSRQQSPGSGRHPYPHGRQQQKQWRPQDREVDLCRCTRRKNNADPWGSSSRHGSGPRPGSGSTVMLDRCPGR